MKIEIRPATQRDIEIITANNAALAMETEHRRLSPDIVRAGVSAALADPAKGRYFVAELAGQVVGQIMHTYEWSDWRNGLVWWIQSVYVVASARRQGIYAGLYRYLQSLAKADRHVRGIRLYVDRRNESAQQVYARLGMNGEHYQVFEWMKDF